MINGRNEVGIIHPRQSAVLIRIAQIMLSPLVRIHRDGGSSSSTKGRVLLSCRQRPAGSSPVGKCRGTVVMAPVVVVVVAAGGVVAVVIVLRRNV